MAATTTQPAAQASQTRSTAIKKAYCGRDNGAPSAGFVGRQSGDTVFDTHSEPKLRRISKLFENYFLHRKIGPANQDGGTTTS
jgi:hypothetical protein